VHKKLSQTAELAQKLY